MLLDFLCMPIVSLLFFLFVWFRLRNAETIILKRMLLTISPFFIGLAISGPLSDSSFLLLGFVFSVILGAWFMFFRFPASYRTAMKQFQTGQFSDALQSLNQTIQEKSDFWEAYQLRALANSALGYFTNAERDAKKAIHLNPNTAINYTALGNVYWQQADFEQARHAYIDAYRLAPNVPLYQYNLGITYFKLGLFEDARDILRQASKSRKLQQKILPENCLYLYYYLAKSEESTGHDDHARRAYKKMKKYQKSLGILKEQLGNCQGTLRESMNKDVADIERILSS